MAAVGTLYVGLQAKVAQFGKDMDAAARKVRKVGFQLQDVGRGLTAGLTLPIVGIGAAAIKMSTDFNESMANVATLIPGNTERVNELKDAVQDAAIATGTSTTTMSEGLYQLISAFGDSAETADLLTLAATSAKAGLATVPDAINLLSATTKAYGDTSLEAQQKVSDLAFTTVKLGQTTFPELAASMGRVIPNAVTLGVAQEELFATFATLTGVTGNASEVSTQFSAVLKAMIKPTKEMGIAIEDLGMGNAEAIIQTLGFRGALEALVAQTDGSQESVAALFGRAEALNAVFSLLGPQSETFTEKLGAMGTAAGATGIAFKEQTEGVNAAGFAWEQVKVQVSVLAQRLGDALGPALLNIVENYIKPLIAYLGSWVDWFTTLDSSIQTFIIAVAGVAAALGPVLVAIGFMLTNLAALGPALASIGGMLIGPGSLGAAIATVITFLSGPAGIIVAVGAVVAAIGIWFSQTEQGSTILSSLWEIVKLLGEIFWNLATVIGTTVYNAIADFVNTVWQNVKPAFDFIYDIIANWVSVALEALIEHLQTARDNLETVGKWLGLVGDDADDMVKEQDKVTKAVEDTSKAITKPSTGFIPALEKTSFASSGMTQELRDAKEEVDKLAKKFELSRRPVILLKDKMLDYRDVLKNEIKKYTEEAKDSTDKLKKSLESLGDPAVLTGIKAAANEDPWLNLNSVIGATSVQLIGPDGKGGVAGDFGKTGEAVKTLGATMSEQVSTVATNFAQSIGDIIFDWGGAWDTLKSIAEAGAKAIISSLIETLVTPFINKITGALSGALGSIFGGSGGVAGTVGGVAGGGGGLGGIFQGGAGAAGGILGSLGSIGSIAAGIGAIAGFFSDEGEDRDEIERNTRYTSIALIGPLGVIDRLIQIIDQNWLFHDALTGDGSVLDHLGNIRWFLLPDIKKILMGGNELVTEAAGTPGGATSIQKLIDFEEMSQGARTFRDVMVGGIMDMINAAERFRYESQRMSSRDYVQNVVIPEINRAVVTRQRTLNTGGRTTSR